MKSITLIFTTILVCLCIPVPRTSAAQRQVVVYTAMDQVFSEPILNEFEKQQNIKVKAVYDVEAVKTTGLVNRLIAEKNNPRCDVFWNNEIMRTIQLKRMGILEKYLSPAAEDIIEQFKDPAGYWAGFAARARVLVVNTNLVTKENYPTSIDDLTNPRWKGKAAMAKPLFGTTATHMAAIFALEGEGQAASFLQNVINNQVKIVDGNSVVRDMVANGDVLFGITDTDDANMGMVSGMPIDTILPDQAGKGTLVIPNTVAMVKGSPHPEEAKKLVDFLLSSQVETLLARSGSAQIPLRKDVAVPVGQFNLEDIVPLKVDFENVVDAADTSTKTLQQLFMK